MRFTLFSLEAVPDGASSTEHRLIRMLEAQRSMSEILLANRGLSGLAEYLHHQTNAPVAIVISQNRVLAASPRHYEWHLENRNRPMTVSPVDLPGADASLVCADSNRSIAELLWVASRLVGLELAKLRAEKAGRRELTGQVLEDIVRSVFSSSEAARRLSILGVNPSAAHSVLLTADDSDTLQIESSLLLAGLELHDKRGTAASIGPYTVVLLQDEERVRDVADQLSRSGDPHGNPMRPVGVGGPYHGIDGLRWAFLEARAAFTQRPGVHERKSINLPRLLMSNPDLPVKEVGHQVLKPLTEYDREHDSELLRTLAAYLKSEGSPQMTAQLLFVHRNTVRYRLEQIEQIIGLSLTSTESRVHLWLALSAIGEVD